MTSNTWLDTRYCDDTTDPREDLWWSSAANTAIAEAAARHGVTPQQVSDRLAAGISGTAEWTPRQSIERAAEAAEACDAS